MAATPLSRAEVEHRALHAVDPASLAEGALRSLRHGAIRLTAARRAVVETLAEQHVHLTAEELADALAARGVHRATVYRTLDVFAHAGILSVQRPPGGATAYHLSTAAHLHALCASCGSVQALPGDSLDGAVRDVLAATGFRVDAQSTTITGRCRGCEGEARHAGERAARR